MKTVLILVKKTADKHISSLFDDYVDRIKHYMTFDLTVIPELKNNRKLSEEQQKNLEGEQIIKCLQPGDVIVLLDEFGKELRSVELANWLTTKMNTVNRRLVFIIGGPYGFSKQIYDKANEKLSLSKLTFSHQMVRLIFVEQLYRALTIINNEPYHHE